MRAQPHWDSDKLLSKNEFRFALNDPMGMIFRNKHDFVFCYPNGKEIPNELGVTGITPIFSLDYHYRVSKCFWVGVSISYGHYEDLRLLFDFYEYGLRFPIGNKTVQTNDLSIMPEIRISYLNRPHLTLYSSLAVGCTALIGITSYDYLDFNLGHVHYYGMHMPQRQFYNIYSAFQFTAFGLKARANHWFGSAELGVGCKGFASLGVGYEF